jgi:hypothetical protein
MGIMKMTSLVTCLCRLHNYCINERLAGESRNTDDSDIPAAMASDSLENIANGGVALEDTGTNRLSPEELLNGGHHNEDTTRAFRRQFERRGMHRDEELPRDRLHKIIVDGGFKGPTPKRWQK